MISSKPQWFLVFAITPVEIGHTYFHSVAKPFESFAESQLELVIRNLLNECEYQLGSELIKDGRFVMLVLASCI